MLKLTLIVAANSSIPVPWWLWALAAIGFVALVIVRVLNTWRKGR